MIPIVLYLTERYKNPVERQTEEVPKRDLKSRGGKRTLVADIADETGFYKDTTRAIWDRRAVSKEATVDIK
jgi:hypothetical protein